MYRLGLIGKTLQHSYSQIYFSRHHPDCHYSPYEPPNIHGIREWAIEERLDGFNVTVPYKEQIIPYLDHLSPIARQIGAVNFVEIVRREGTWMFIGYNTDSRAFEETLQPLLTQKCRRAVVLGAGGAAKAVGHALARLGLDFICLTHSEIDNIGNEPLPKHQILINATPVGMYPNIDRSPIDVEAMGRNKELIICYDLTYNPPETLFLKYGKQCGSITKNGLDMLFRQAELCYRIIEKLTIN